MFVIGRGSYSKFLGFVRCNIFIRKRRGKMKRLKDVDLKDSYFKFGFEKL